MAAKIKIFWIMALYSLVVNTHILEATYCLCIQGKQGSMFLQNIGTHL
jgi:hypothetical protein